MYWLKACGRCHGDLHEINDVGETYVSCIQCGRILTAEQERALPRPRRATAQATAQATARATRTRTPIQAGAPRPRVAA